MVGKKSIKTFILDRLYEVKRKQLAKFKKYNKQT